MKFSFIFFYTVAFLLFGEYALCQTNESEADKNSDGVYSSVDIKPDFPGGVQAFYQFVGETYKVPRKFKGTGKLLIQFVVEKDGSLSEFKVIKDAGKGTGEAAFAMLKKSPKWKPGIQNGKPVRVYYTLPLIIKEAPSPRFKSAKDIVE